MAELVEHLKIPEDLGDFLEVITQEFPRMLPGNLVGVYLWGSLTYGAFDKACSDVDFVCVTRRDLDDVEFARVDEWLRGQTSRWVKRVDMRFVIEGEFLDKLSRCCGFYHYNGKLVRHGSDGNPIIWINIGQSGVTLWGKDAKAIAPKISEERLREALLLELDYLREDLASNAGDRSREAFVHNAYAVLTACRILYTAKIGELTSKEQAAVWATERLEQWREVITRAWENRAKAEGMTTPELERKAREFVAAVTNLVTAT